MDLKSLRSRAWGWLEQFFLNGFGAGVLFGALVGLLLYDVMGKLGVVHGEFDFSDIVIASCTAVLVYYARSTFLSSQRLAVWNSNKDVLLELLRCLSVSIGQYEKFIHACDCERALMNPQLYSDDHDFENPDFTLDPDYEERLKKALFEVEEVYLPVLPKDVKGLIVEFRKRDKEIELALDDAALDVCEAYVELRKASLKLQTGLKEFVADFSGVKQLHPTP